MIDILLQALLAGALQVPGPPTGLEVERATNPASVGDNRPDFRATNPGPGAATRYRIQVSTVSDFSSITHWDGPAGGTAFAPSVPQGSQTSEIPYGATGTVISALSWNTLFHWRIKFWNSSGEGAWSTEAAAFTMASPSASASANLNGLQTGDSWRMIGVPVANGTSVSATELLDDGAFLFRWEEPTRLWIQLGSSDFLDGARGYYLYTPLGATVDLAQGTVASGTQTFSLSRTGLPAATGQEVVDGRPRNGYRGWNFLSNPFNAPILWDRPVDGGHVRRTRVSASHSKWNGTQYLVYNARRQRGAAGPLIEPFQGFFVQALSGSNSISILQPSPTSGGPLSVAPKRGAAAPGDPNEWGLELEARSGSALDTENVAAVAFESLDEWDESDSEEPGPGTTTWLLLSFEHWDWIDEPRDYTHDTRRTPVDIGDEVVWNLTLSGNTGLPATITWPNVDRLATAEWVFTLEDPAGPSSVDLASTPSYETGPVNGSYPLLLRARRLTEFRGSLEVSLSLPGPQPGVVAPGTAGVRMLDLELAARSEPVRVDGLTVTHVGAGDPAEASVWLYRSGAPIAGPVSLSGGNAVFAGLDATLPADAPEIWTVVYDFSTSASGTYQAGVAAASISGTGVYSLKAMTPASAAITGPEATVSAPASGGGGGGGCGLTGLEGLLLAGLLARRFRRGLPGRPPLPSAAPLR